MTGSDLIRAIEMLGAQDMVVLIAPTNNSLLVGAINNELLLTQARIKKGDVVDMLVLGTEMVMQG
jgi:hypothetical protein